ncbi:hypothetical protein WMY93_027221 [Mugilogobius chulae]|uniref:Centrosomal protein of 104 kDa n=1 Tax=Mugilogobius chulae TaxID=88201 RepID=A0AAW0MWY9_9GOBI
MRGGCCQRWLWRRHGASSCHLYADVCEIVRGMPRKIGFIVVSSSSHEENYSPEELKIHAPTARGWRSCRRCSYPQSLTLQLEERTRVRRLQLLAHQYMIPSKVEFHIGDSLPNSSDTGPLRRLGYVSLSDNQQTSFKARELKSVHVDVIATHLRITLHQNHDNRHNRYNQVALVAVNVLGDSLDGIVFNTTIPSREQLIEHYLSTGQQEAALDATYTGKCESISPLDDLAFDMYQDPEMAQLIRLLDQRKQEMVHQERFEEARHVKQALADLHVVGERLARLEVEKRCALQKEDFDQAEQKKQQIEQYRRTVYHQLEAHQLLQPTQTSASVSECSPCSLPSPDLSPVHTNPSSSSTRSDQKSGTSNSQPELTASSRPSTLQVAGVPYDERPLPALENRDRCTEPALSPAEELSVLHNTSGISGHPEPLTEKAQRQAADAIDAFGENIVRAAYSKKWSYREDALTALQQRLKEVSSSGTKEKLRMMVRAAVSLLKKGLQDKVSSVFQCALRLLLLLLSDVIPAAGLGRAEVSLCLEQTWAHLLPRTGDDCSRLRLAALSAAQEMAVLKEVRALQWIPGELVKPIPSTLPSRLAQSRAELLERLLSALGLDGSGFTLDNVMTFCYGALGHSSPAVRDTAVQRKNFIYKKIFDGFAKIDGKLADTQEAGARPQEQVQSVQQQLADFREKPDKEKSTKAQREAAKEEKVARRVARANLPKVDREVAQVVATPESVGNYLDNLCIFCGRKDESFTEEGLDRHYWKHCPMLRLCDHCKQVVEISSLTEHLLGECESQASFSQCPQCSEAVPCEELRSHMEGPACRSSSPGKASNHCPLCHTNFQPGEEAWKAHLMGREAVNTTPGEPRCTRGLSLYKVEPWTAAVR